MTTPGGIEVRPIRNAVGESHFCEIFLDDVVIPPAANLIGAENEGWQVAQATLGAERGMTMLELAERLGNAGFRWLVQACQPVDDALVADRLAQFEIEIAGLRGLCRDLVLSHDTGGVGAADASVVKLFYSELLQRMTDFGAEIGGLPLTPRSPNRPPAAGSRLVDAGLHRLLGVDDSGRSSEIQRTIIAERGLGLRANRV